MNQAAILQQSINHRVHLGRYGENQAASYLEGTGLQIIERNWRWSNFGEIDLVAKDDDTVVFVEVKTRRGIGAGLASEAVTQQKLDRLKRLGAAWMSQNGKWLPYRFDIVGVYVREGREPIFEWLQDVGQ